MIASGSFDKTVKIWDASTGTEIKTMAGASSYVNAIAFSPDGKTIAAGTFDQLVIFWDAATGEEMHLLKGHSGGITSVVFSLDGTMIASGSEDKTVKIWDAATGEVMHTLAGHSGAVTSVAISPDGTRIVSGSQDNTVKIWDAITGQEIRTLAGHTEDVHAVAFSPNGMFIASGSADTSVKFWEVATGSEVGILTGHKEPVRALVFSPDGTRIVTCSLDKSVKIWDVVRCQEIQTLTGHTQWVYSVAISPDGTRIASGSYDKTVKVWKDKIAEAKVKAEQDARARAKEDATRAVQDTKAMAEQERLRKEAMSVAITSALDLFRAAGSCQIAEVVEYVRNEGGQPGANPRVVKLDILQRIKDKHLEASLNNDVITFGSKPASLESAVSAAIEVVRQYDVAAHYIRYKVAVRNKTPFVITGITIDLDVEESIFFLVDIKPQEAKDDLRRGLATIQSIQPGASVGIDFHLEPRTCGTGIIGGSVTYRDHINNKGFVPIKPLEIPIKCPLVMKVGQAMVAQVNAFIERVPPCFRQYKLESDAARAFVIGCKAVQQNHDMELVGNETQENPYRGSAWFHAVAKVSGHEIAVKVDVERDQLTISVSAEVREEAIGLLTRLHAEYTAAMEEAGISLSQVRKDIIDAVEKGNREIMQGIAGIITEMDSKLSKMDEISDKLKDLAQKFSDLETRGDFSGADAIRQQMDAMRAENRQIYAAFEASLAGMAGNLEKIVKGQENVELLLKDKLGTDWDKIKDAWASYKRGEKSFRDLLNGALKELGKRGIKKLITTITGGLVDLGTNSIKESLNLKK